jgi:hypothetical protein
MRARSAGPRKRSSVTTPGAAARNRARSRRAYSVCAEPNSSGVTCALSARAVGGMPAVLSDSSQHARAPPQARHALPAAARARRWRPGTRRPPRSAAAPSPATGARSSSAGCARAPARARRRAAPRQAEAARPAAVGSGRGPSAAPAAGPAAHSHPCRDGSDVTAMTRCGGSGARRPAAKQPAVRCRSPAVAAPGPRPATGAAQHTRRRRGSAR